MAIETVRQYFNQWNREKDIIELESSSATVEMAAEALGVEAARIAKTLAFRHEDGVLLIVAAGDAKTDNAKYKAEFGEKPRMASPDEVLELTGHAVGGVCPFGLKNKIPVYLDISLKRFETIFPACGSSNSAIRLTCGELDEYAGNQRWVDVCKGWG